MAVDDVVGGQEHNRWGWRSTERWETEVGGSR
jgi:hypothetical protein